MSIHRLVHAHYLDNPPYVPTSYADTVSLLRPLARRAASTRLPLAVAIRARKPCLFTFFLTEG